jgi:hypothetical protein
MNPKLSSRLIGLFPQGWRERYGDEFEKLLEREGVDFATIFDVVRAACWQRVLSFFSNGDGNMQTYPASVVSLARKPSAFLPIAMSLCALTVIGVLALNGIQREPDEGAAAHIWQLLMAGQLPILAFFAVKWLARNRKAALSILALQLIGFGAALLPVWLLNL